MTCVLIHPGPASIGEIRGSGCNPVSVQITRLFTKHLRRLTVDVSYPKIVVAPKPVLFS